MTKPEHRSDQPHPRPLDAGSVLDSAGWYADHGWPVIPLHSAPDGVCSCRKGVACDSPGKHPRIRTGPRHGAASTEADEVGEWFAKWPDANVGVVTGLASGLVVIDVDPRHEGELTLRRLESEHGPLPLTVTSATGGGGKHFLFSHPGEKVKTSAGDVGRGVDVRADGGMIVVPPSVHASGAQYEWVTPPTQLLAELPRWVLTAPKPGADPSAKWITEGGRRTALLSYAGQLRWQGLSRGEILPQLRTMNQQRCRPPLLDDEVADLAWGIERYPPGPGAGGQIAVPRFNETDMGNAERLVDQHGDDLLYSHEQRRWYEWTGRLWVPDRLGAVQRRAKQTIGSIYHEAAGAHDPQRAAQLGDHAKASQRRERVAAAIKLSEDDLAVLVTDFDRDPNLLNVANGTLDLQLGELRDHRREDRLTKMAGCSHEPSASAPQWQDFLSQTFSGSTDLIQYVQRLIGYSAVGVVTENVLPILYGEGANGKTTLVEVVRLVLGDYAHVAPPELLLAQQRSNRDGPTPALADLHGRRFVTTMETGEGRQLDEPLVKQLTGGDTITARHLYADLFSFTPSHTVFLVTNHPPDVLGRDHAIWRRIRLIPFTAVIPEDQQDRALRAKLLSEAPGILNWILEGTRLWLQGGLLGTPAEVVAATKGYQATSDSVSRFVAERCRRQPDAWCASGDLLPAYQEWCQSQGETPLKGRRWGGALRDLGFKSHKRHGEGWLGVDLVGG